MISISQLRLLRKLYRLTQERDNGGGRKGNLISDEYINKLSEQYGLEKRLRDWYGWKKERQGSLDIRMEKLRFKGLITFQSRQYDYVRVTLMGEDCAKHPVRDYLLYLGAVLFIPTLSAVLASLISIFLVR